jgi:hypothetical protein
VVFIVVFSISLLVIFRERLTELQRPCHDGEQKIETVFQRSELAVVPANRASDMTSER